MNPTQTNLFQQDIEEIKAEAERKKMQRLFNHWRDTANRDIDLMSEMEREDANDWVFNNCF
jgi:hypothetical protein